MHERNNNERDRWVGMREDSSMREWRRSEHDDRRGMEGRGGNEEWNRGGDYRGREDYRGRDEERGRGDYRGREEQRGYDNRRERDDQRGRNEYRSHDEGRSRDDDWRGGRSSMQGDRTGNGRQREHWDRDEANIPNYERNRYDRDRESYSGWDGRRERHHEDERHGMREHDRSHDYNRPSGPSRETRGNGHPEYLGRYNDGGRPSPESRGEWNADYDRRHDDRRHDDRRRDRSEDRGDLRAEDFEEYRGRDYGFSWRDGSNDATWRQFDRWGNEYSNHWRNEGFGWNRGSTRDPHFWSSPDRER